MAKITKNPHYALDAFDKNILSIVQENNQLSHNVIGKRVGLSTSAVRRRLSNLRSAGVISKDVSLIKPDSFGVTLIVTINFGDESIEAYDALDQLVLECLEIQQSYHVAGSNDYIMIVHCPSLQWYEEWSKNTFMTNSAIRRYSTAVVWSCKKFETKIVL
jgi:Lrp/AsnC family leucine-responsive transcriptional regulator